MRTERRKAVKNKAVFVVVLLAVIVALGLGLVALSVRQQDRETGVAGQDTDVFTVVTSFYPMYIAAENVIGDCADVRLENLSEPQTGCLHDYQLTTEDMKLLDAADVFVVNGGGIETFLTEVAAQYPDLTVVDACADLTLLEDNAHAWMSVTDYRQQVETIRDGLAATDKAHADRYRENAAAYLEELTALAEECASLRTELAGQPVVLFHDAYAYLAEDLGLSVVGEMDLDEEREVSAREVADILSAIETEQVPVIFAEETYAKEMGDRMEAEADVTVLYLDPLTRGTYDAASYLTAMWENLTRIQEAYIR